MSRRALPAVAVWGFLAACAGDADSGPAEPIVHDSAGVTIVEHPGDPLADGADVPGWIVDLEGALELPGDFFQVEAAFRFPGGRIAVAERNERRITFFEADGSRGESVGGEGEGPGEFRALSAAHRWPGDSILVFDIQLRRLTLFDAEGELGRTFQLEVTDEVPFASLRGVHADGSMLGTGFTDSPPGGPEDGRRRYPSPVYRFDPEGRLDRDLGVGSGSETYYQSIDGGFTFLPALFQRSTRVVAGPEYLLVAANDAFELVLEDDEGPVTIIRADGPPRPLTQEARRGEIERRLEKDTSNRDPDELREILESMPVPETLPAYDRVAVDRTGAIWVEAFEPERGAHSLWTVFDPDGDVAARVELPRAFEPMEIGEDHLLGVLTDELGVERVVLVPFGR